MAQKLTLDAFKTLLKKDEDFRDNITKGSDIVDLDNGVMRIHEQNLNKYLEKYACKDAEDLQNTLWYSYGVFCQVIE
jgi:hypothetical protein